MNEREALEKMKILFFNIKGCTHSTSGQPNKRAYELAKEGQDIAIQALAPQEAQEKTFTVEEIKKLQTETLIRLNPDDARKAQWLFSVFNNLLAKFEKAVE